jgi:fumarate reductase flavoprotein subunit
MAQTSTDFSKTRQADMVIIGGGGAGLSAAVAAAEAGAKDVIVLESRPAPGGNTALAQGILATETALQRHLGFDVSRDDVFRSIMDYAHWRPNAVLIRSLVDLSGENISWLEEKGMKFGKLIPHYPNQVLMTYHACSGAKGTGALVVKALMDSCKHLGIPILCGTAAKKLLTDEKGNVSGVLALTEGKEIRIDTQGVIIATGGFAGNNSLLKKYLPFYHDEMVLRGLPHKGDGLLMAAEAGAATGGVMALESEGPAFVESKHLAIMVRRPNTLWVNKLGQRFADESSLSLNEAANAMYDQPGKMSYTLLDENLRQQNFQQNLSPFESMIMDDDAWQNGAGQALEAQIGDGKVMRADSWSEIAAWIGADPQVLESTIDTYNHACEQGYDRLFVKDHRDLLPLNTPPYYAIPGKIQLLVTHGGIRINPCLEVLDQKDRPIGGLYCAGDDTNGRIGDTYNIRLSGLSMCFAIGSGRLAGKNAAEYVTNNRH